MSGRGALVRLVVAPAAYGFSVGAVRSWRFALLDLVKFPLLFAISIVVCAASYFLVARLVAPSLTLGDVRRLVIEVYAGVAVLLASLGSVCLFFALTIAPPTSTENLGEYPWFLGLNVLLIAVFGSLAVVRQASRLLRDHGLSRTRMAVTVAGWLTLSLLVGGQCAWYLRPFFGNRAVPDDGSFCLGTRPDFRGAESFYEAVYHLAAPPSRGRPGAPAQ
jgi:hypothetical protein